MTEQPAGWLMLGQPNADYHTGRGLSHSGLKRFRRSPYHFHAMQGRPGKEPTAAMFNGTLTHCALLEPREFALRYSAGPEGVTKAQKAWKDHVAECAKRGLEPITPEQWELAWSQANALRDLPEVAELLSQGEAEVSAYWKDPKTGILCKCRPDWISPVAHGKGVVILDVKTTDDASDEGFSRSVSKYGYHQQADWYSAGYALASGLEVHGFLFAVVESEYPFAARAIMLSDSALAKAAQENREALDHFAACAAENNWPGYAPGITVLDLPQWHK